MEKKIAAGPTTRSVSKRAEEQGTPSTFYELETPTRTPRRKIESAPVRQLMFQDEVLIEEPENLNLGTERLFEGGNSSASSLPEHEDYEGLAQLSEEEWNERERRFEKKMRKKGYIIKKMGEDGACLFKAVADQLYGDQDMHPVVRKHCMDYIAVNGDYYAQYVKEDFENYVNRKRLEYVHGNHLEIQAIFEMYNRTIEIFCYSEEPIYTFHGTNQYDNEPIRLSYHRGVHYNILVDPYKTKEDLEEQGDGECYLQWLKEDERLNRAARSPPNSSSSATSTPAEVRSPRQRSQSPIPPRSSTLGSGNPGAPGTSNPTFQLLETSSFINQLPLELFGMNQWDDAGLMAQVLAVSQQEYLDTLKRTVDPPLSVPFQEGDGNVNNVSGFFIIVALLKLWGWFKKN